jgi:iron complex outermembrane recepter protein
LQRPTAGGGALQWQVYYDHTERTVQPTFAETLDIMDVQFLHRPASLGRHDLAWGLNYRRSHDRVENSPFVAFLPAELHQTWVSLYLQDRIGLSDDIDFTVGARVERNDYTGYEFLPSLRLAWRTAPDSMLWMAASRAVRAPSRLDRDTRLPGLPPYLLDGGPAADSELADVYEIGYRSQPTPQLSWSATVYHASYDRLRTLALNDSGTGLIFASDMAGHARGFEGWGQFQATPAWRLRFGMSLLDESLHLKPGGVDTEAPLQVGLDPSVTWQLRSSWDLGEAVEFDLGLRHVGELARNDIPAYTSVDARLGWRLRPDLELSLSGQNLDGSHAEYGQLQYRTEVGRRFVLRLVWQP